ncbi:glycosyltransferase family 2 protein [Confluentibacter flavum]|uniref:Glycosyltransferase family 2 protein n=1 Tax=Confluentibacter flavum TaxID=1909700 RepID=A0A2N3HF89_9FLAO|nr:glycosyltransferase family 2 protein [Confluentibacter flavum]PKQ43572.1 glycosyltransferase family 2 protein [Confluentibacter flavum]
MPFFSVIIPLYNKEAYIIDTLKSVSNQSFQDFEIIIVDDGSTDNSLHLVSQFTDSRIQIIRQENKGASVARNNGIQYSKSLYIALLDADDLWYEDHLFELKKCITLFRNAVLYCNNYEIKRHDTFKTNAVFNFNYKKNCLIIDDFFKANIINFIPSSSSVAFLKTNFLKLNGYNIKLRTGQDIDLWIKFGLLGDIAFNPKITMSYNLFDSSSLSNKEYNEDRYWLINNYLKEEKFNPSLKMYLDVNRYAVALRSKIYGPQWVYENLEKEIEKSNLNKKQRFLLKLPVFLLKFMKGLHRFLIKKGVYTTSYY